MPELVRWPRERFTTPPQARHDLGSPEELMRLCQSIETVGQLQPIGCGPTGEVYYGFRRLAAIRMSQKLKEVLAYVYEQPLTEKQFRIINLTENLQRKDLSDAEVYRACKDLLVLNPEWLRKDLATHIHLSAAMVTRILAVDDLIPAARDAFLAGQFGFGTAYTIASAKTETEQTELLAARLGGASRETLNQQRRRAAQPASTVRLSRVRCVLPGGVNIAVSGEALSLEDLIESLSVTLEAARKANKELLDIRTFERVLRDKAKAGE